MTTKYVSPVDYSIAAEKATGLGISGRRLRLSLDALRAHDERDPAAEGDPAFHAEVRARLLDEAAEACWGYVVQREILGLGVEDADYVLETYRVPEDVRRALGPKARRHARR